MINVLSSKDGTFYFIMNHNTVECFIYYSLLHLGHLEIISVKLRLAFHRVQVLVKQTQTRVFV